MFEDSTFESTGRIKTRSRRWMVAALGLNGSILAALILIPLIYPEALQRVGPLIVMEAPKPQPEPNRPIRLPEQRDNARQDSNATQVFVAQRNRIFIATNNGPEPGPPNTDFTNMDSGPAVPSGVGNAFSNHESGPAVRVAPAGPRAVSSGVMAGQIVYKVTPQYPAMGRAVRAEGTVVLEAVISKTGTIENLRVVSGPALLQGAAIDAVKQWRYRPYVLDGQPVEVETTVNVVFTLGR
jgi:protein TonB